MISSRLVRALHIALWLTLAVSAAEACGPEFFPDLFVRTKRPDRPEQFIKGRLGLLQPRFARADHFAAYRYLSGGTLDRSEQQSWQATESLAEQDYGSVGPQVPTQAAGGPQADTPVNRWTALRKQFSNAPQAEIQQELTVQIPTPQGYTYEGHPLNCADDAFTKAAETLQARAGLWGKGSALLMNWLSAQDAVFQACSGPAAAPGPVPAGSPPLLMQDRAYQTAAWDFYSQHFPRAAAEFVAIGQDSASPWQPLGGYLAGRVLIRQAFFSRLSAADSAEYDPALLQAAQRQLQTYLASKPPASLQHAAERQLALIQIRLEPVRRTHELAALVSGPAPDGNYAQDVQDLLWITSKNTPDALRGSPDMSADVPDPAHPGQVAMHPEVDAAFQKSLAERTAEPIVDWTLTFESPSGAAAVHALERWRATHAVPWLVAALVLTPNSAKAPADLLDASAQVAAGSPAWETVTYHRARLLLAGGQAEQARQVLATFLRYLEALPPAEREPSTINGVRGLEMSASTTSAALLSHAPRMMLLASSEAYSSLAECRSVMEDPKRQYDCSAHVSPGQLDGDAAELFNHQAPLSFWLKAATDQDLSAQLRTAVAEQGWTRAVLLEDQASEAAFLPLLPEKLRDQAQAGHSALSPWITLARNPGLLPYLNAGTQRAYSYDFVESYRDNWCYKADPAPGDTLPASALSVGEQQAGVADARRVDAIRSLEVGRRLVTAIGNDPKQPEAAEALYLTLRMIRYGCTEPAQPPRAGNTLTDPNPSQESKDLLQLNRDAARLLRRYFVDSPWIRRSAPFVL